MLLSCKPNLKDDTKSTIKKVSNVKFFSINRKHDKLRNTHEQQIKKYGEVQLCYSSQTKQRKFQQY